MTSKVSIWRLFPPEHETFDKGHGRIEVRRVWASSELNGYVNFPHVGQVIRIERSVTKLDGSPLRKHSTEVCLAVTSLQPERASAERLLKLNREHWSIENKVHYVRDVTFDEDRSQVRKQAAPQMMASLRNLAISLLRMAGAGISGIAAAVRHCARKVRTTLRLIGL